MAFPSHQYKWPVTQGSKQIQIHTQIQIQTKYKHKQNVKQKSGTCNPGQYTRFHWTWPSTTLSKKYIEFCIISYFVTPLLKLNLKIFGNSFFSWNWLNIKNMLWCYFVSRSRILDKFQYIFIFSTLVDDPGWPKFHSFGNKSSMRWDARMSKTARTHNDSKRFLSFYFSYLYVFL